MPYDRSTPRPGTVKPARPWSRTLLALLRAARAALAAANVGPAPRRIRIFLASSAELEADRDDFDLRVRRFSDRLLQRGIYLEVVRWEYFFDAMSTTRMQDEYNTAVRECDIFVSLFFTKSGKFTEEEFTAAYDSFRGTGRPLVYTYFKDASITTGAARKQDLTSLWAFQEKLTEMGHFWTMYENIDQLIGKFRDQLDEFLDRG